MIANEKLRNKDREYVVGIWWMRLLSGNSITLTVYRADENYDIWNSVYNSKGYEESSTLTTVTGCGGDEDLVNYIEKAIDSELEAGDVQKLVRFICRTDDEDIFYRIIDVFNGMGIKLVTI